MHRYTLNRYGENRLNEELKPWRDTAKLFGDIQQLITAYKAQHGSFISDKLNKEAAFIDPHIQDIEASCIDCIADCDLETREEKLSADLIEEKEYRERLYDDEH